MNSIHPSVFLIAVYLLIVGCSGEGSSFGQGRGGNGVSEFSLKITDAPVDGVREVWVQVTGYTIQPSSGNAQSKEIDPVNVNLLSLQGINSLDLVDRDLVPAGDYSWLRLHVNAINDGIMDSYVTEFDGSTHELSIPSGSETGLKLNIPFTLVTGEHATKIIDFDLRISLVLTGSGNYQLRPTLRMVDNALTGSISGRVDTALISSSAQCSDSDPDTFSAIYVFEGANVVPDDIDNESPNPITSANVVWNAELDEYVFEIGFLEAGEYTIALTCQADLDDPTTNDNISFVSTENATVVISSDATSNHEAR